MTDRTRRPSRRDPAKGPARRLLAGLVCVMVVAVTASLAPAQILRREKPAEIQNVDVIERLGETVPLHLPVTDSSGATVRLSRYIDAEKPTVLALVYFGCPVVCPLVLDRLTNSFRDLDYTIGEDFNVIVLSIDHSEGPTESAAAKSRYVGVYGRDRVTVERGWGFLTADEQTVAEIARSVGWGYKQLPNGEYSHATAVVVLSPDGMVARYIYGFDFPAKQMKLSLLEASEGRIAQSLGDKIMFFCYRYDPTAGAYSMEAMAVMRIAGALTVVALIVLISGLFVYEKTIRKSARHEASEAGGGDASEEPRAAWTA